MEPWRWPDISASDGRLWAQPPESRQIVRGSEEERWLQPIGKESVWKVRAGTPLVAGTNKRLTMMARTRGGRKVLVIDRDPAMRMLLRRALEEAGYEVREAREAGEGRNIAKDEGCALAVVEVTKPGRDGLDAVVELKRTDSAMRIIGTAGDGGLMDFLSHSKASGVDRAVRRTFETDHLVEAVAEELGLDVSQKE